MKTTQQAYAVSAYCDDVTRTDIEERIALDNFDCGVGGNEIAANVPLPRRFTIPPVDPVAGEPTMVGSLTEFISFLQMVFSMVEVVDEARNQVERTLGQTHFRAHLWAFSRC